MEGHMGSRMGSRMAGHMEGRVKGRSANRWKGTGLLGLLLTIMVWGSGVYAEGVAPTRSATPARAGLPATAALPAKVPAKSAAPVTETVDINTADAETLERVLDGVGRSRAEAIVAYRQANGRFFSPEELTAVKGIGPSTVERNAGRIKVD